MLLTDQTKLIKKIDNLILKYGIPIYITKWKKIKNKFKFTENPTNNKFVFYNDINNYVKLYHSHSYIYYMKQKEDKSNKIVERPMPTFTITNDNILIIKVFHYFTGGKYKDGKFIIPKKAENDKIKLINLIKSKLKNIDKYKGLIIDFLDHFGGQEEPLLLAFSELLNDNTLYSYNKTKTKYSDKKWTIMKNNKIKHNQLYIKNNKLNTVIPVAIIMGNSTASAGELCVSAFYGKSNVKMFGMPSAGLLSSVHSSFHNDINICITEFLITTSNGIFHNKEKLFPDVLTQQPLQEAINWIKNSYK